MEPFLIAGGVVGVAASLAALAYRRERQRTAAFARFAEERGYSFQVVGPSAVPEAPPFRLLTRGHSRQLTHVVRGEKDGATVFLADYTHVTGGGRNRTRHRQTLCLIRSPDLELPRFFVRPQRAILDAVGKLLGGQDLDLEDDPEFSRAFVLQVGDGEARAVARTFTPAVRSHLLGLADRRFQLEAWGQWLLWENDRRLEVPAEVEAVLVQAVNLRRILAYDTRKQA